MKNDKNFFPYKPNKKTVIIGGTTAWSKQMKRLLPTVDIIPIDSKKNYKNIIANADVVWINDKISHNYYGKILNEARKQKKELKYFYYNGPESCVEQIYDYEILGKYYNKYLKSN